MIKTGSEGTSYCTECENWARENERLRKALKKAVGWMGPVMDGFNIKYDADARTKVLNICKRLSKKPR